MLHELHELLVTVNIASTVMLAGVGYWVLSVPSVCMWCNLKLMECELQVLHVLHPKIFLGMHFT